MDQTLKSEDVQFVYELGQMAVREPDKALTLFKALVANHAMLVLNVAKQMNMIDDVRLPIADSNLVITMSSAQHREVMQLINRDRKIDAIKLTREFTKCGLKEAKDAVESWDMMGRLTR